MSTITIAAHRACLVLPFTFPEGLAPGHGRHGNRLELVVDHNGCPLLRGTALAGVLRHAWAECHGTESARDLFGYASDATTRGAASGRPSRVAVADHRLELPSGAGVVFRQHNAVDRDRGSVVDGRLFGIDALPPGTSTDVVLWLEGDDRASLVKTCDDLVSLAAGGLIFGASHARGIGRAVVGTCRARLYDLATDLGAYLADHRLWREKPGVSADWPKGSKELTATVKADNRLTLSLALTIPPGQDLLVAADRDGRPQQVIVEGAPVWRLPGSTIRGLLRDWCIRLARRGEPTLPAGLAPDEAVCALFGFVEDPRNSGFNDLPGACRGPDAPRIAAGRIHVTDGHAPRRSDPDEVLGRRCRPEDDVQNRMHVAVDRISGGASDGALFDRQVVVSPQDGHTVFRLELFVSAPRAHEAAWLARFFTALDLGVIRLGSSKAAGRVSVAINSQALPDDCNTAFTEHLRLGAST